MMASHTHTHFAVVYIYDVELNECHRGILLVWQYFEDHKALRCGTRMSLRESGCSEKDIVDPESQHTVAEEGESLSPQRIKLDLRPG